MTTAKEKRCGWCLSSELYIDYHDNEWGVPCYDARALFEMLNLEGAQAGLSWITILNKRDNYRRLFADFDVAGESFVDFLWSFVDYTVVQNQHKSMATVQGSTDQSKRMSKALKKSGFKFVGPTTCYAFMQASGMVNDHLVTNSVLDALPLWQMLLVGACFIWSGFVRSGLGFGGTALSLPLLLIFVNDPLIFLPAICFQLLTGVFYQK